MIGLLILSHSLCALGGVVAGFCLVKTTTRWLDHLFGAGLQ